MRVFFSVLLTVLVGWVAGVVLIYPQHDTLPAQTALVPELNLRFDPGLDQNLLGQQQALLRAWHRCVEMKVLRLAHRARVHCNAFNSAMPSAHSTDSEFVGRAAPRRDILRLVMSEELASSARSPGPVRRRLKSLYRNLAGDQGQL